jgi:hypothetical protein
MEVAVMHVPLIIPLHCMPSITIARCAVTMTMWAYQPCALPTCHSFFCQHGRALVCYSPPGTRSMFCCPTGSPAISRHLLCWSTSTQACCCPAHMHSQFLEQAGPRPPLDKAELVSFWAGALAISFLPDLDYGDRAVSESVDGVWGVGMLQVSSPDLGWRLNGVISHIHTAGQHSARPVSAGALELFALQCTLPSASRACLASRGQGAAPARLGNRSLAVSGRTVRSASCCVHAVFDWLRCLLALHSLPTSCFLLDPRTRSGC